MVCCPVGPGRSTETPPREDTETGDAEAIDRDSGFSNKRGSDLVREKKIQFQEIVEDY